MSDRHLDQTLVSGSRMPQVLEPDTSKGVQTLNMFLPVTTVVIRPYRRGVWGVTPYLRSGGAAGPNVMRYGRRRCPKNCRLG